MGTKPVIVVVAYRRLHTLERLLHSLENGIYNVDDITLIISIDYHPDNGDVIEYAKSFRWRYGEKIIKTHEKNLGLRCHIVECGDYAVEYGAVIILEDDELVAPLFYEYTRMAHDFYNTDDRIAGISLYGHEWNDYAEKKFQPILQTGDVYFGQFSCTRGQSWSAYQWSCFKNWLTTNEEIREDELLPLPIYSWNKSWGKYFIRYLVETNKYYVMPYRPVCTVFGEVGTHSMDMELDVQISLDWGRRRYTFIPFENGVHYDAFFENVDVKKIVAQKFDIPEDEICIDIYALKGRKFTNKNYVLTTKKLKKKVLASYDLNMRPQEINVILDISGEGIFLYDLRENVTNKKYHPMRRLEYDLGGVPSQPIFAYGIRHSIKMIFKVVFGKKKGK